MMRHRSSPVGLNLDSLLDTMTNGVGILIIVLCVTQVEVGRTVREARGKTPISTEQLKALLDKHGQVASAVRGLTEQWKAVGASLRSDEAQLAELEKNLPRLRGASAAATPDSPVPGLEKKIADAQGYFKGLSDDIAARDGQLVEKQKTLEGLEAAAKRAKAAAIRERPLPQVRPLPDPRTKAVAFCFHRGQVFPVNFKEITDAWRRGMDDAVGGPTAPLDGFRIKQYFDQRDVGTPVFRITSIDTKVPAIPRLDVRPTARGETAQEIQNPASVFFRAIQAAKASNDAGQPMVVQFGVYGDSFEAYLIARGIADAAGLPGSWILLAPGEGIILGGGRKVRD